MKRLWLALAAPLVGACTTLVPPPDVDLTGIDPHAAWARVLATRVSPTGTVDFAGLAEDSGDLDAYVAWLARERDAATDDEERLAHLVNAYNALAMFNVLNGGVEPESKVRFFYLRRLVLDGERLSLYALENDVIRPLGEPRIHFALNCMVRSCPRLPRVPFEAATLDAQLDAAAREFANDPRHVELDPDAREVRLSAILDWYEEDFLEVAPSLVAYLDRYRDEPIPADWDVTFLAYDWSLNDAR